ncbi:MAG: hypothetical protein FD170_3939 [Bacteroidetes bacterium]|nr:MAG: hypothetical protein FD170_3939 [Bacteroidota bacterium]
MEQLTEAYKSLIKALEIIAGKAENRGVIECPQCGGQLRYARAKSNGHVHGHCKTEGCLSWMQ